MSPRYVVVIVLLIAGAFASWLLVRQNRGDDRDDITVDPVHRGYYLVAARILGTGSDGSLLYEILAESAEQQDDKRITFTNVTIKYSPQSDVPWVISADTASIHQDERRVLLRGHVRAVSQEGFSGNETEIRTEYLELDPENFLAETSERVQIRIGARSLTASGMLASLKENRLELKSNVSGKFVP